MTVLGFAVVAFFALMVYAAFKDRAAILGFAAFLALMVYVAFQLPDTGIWLVAIVGAFVSLAARHEDAQRRRRQRRPQRKPWL
jgi:uncharacterized membrane protein